MKTIIATRKSPQSLQSGQLSLGWCAISHRHFCTKSERRRLTGNWICIRSEHAKIYRVLRFSATLRADVESNNGDLVLDYDGWLKLSDFIESTPEALQVTIDKVRWWQLPFCAIGHPDPSYRLSSWLGIISVVLGLIGMGLGVLSCF